MTKAGLWALAQRKAALAPHGQRLRRLVLLRRITAELLEAELKAARA